MTELTQDEESLLMSEDEVEISIDPESFVKLALAFPCFGDARPDSDPTELFNIIMEAYKDDNLSEEQDLVVELVLHLHEESSPFNLRRAVEIWETGDKEVLCKLVSTGNL